MSLMRYVDLVPIASDDSKDQVEQAELKFWTKALTHHFGSDRREWPTVGQVGHRHVYRGAGVFQEMWVDGKKLAAFDKDALGHHLILIGEIYGHSKSSK